MRIISWNCNGKFPDKFHTLLSLNADIYVIQECEDPAESSSDEYKHFALNYIWTGENKNRGLGVFAKNGICIKENNWPKYCLRNFLSIRVNNCFDLLAVWACKPYIEEYYIYQSINLPNYNEDIVIIGDFNSNVIWDDKHYTRTHSAIVQQLNTLGLCSAYHHLSGEAQGKETTPTFCLYRHPDKSYHIDHCFISETRIQNYHILDNLEWMKKSDHFPLLLEIK